MGATPAWILCCQGVGQLIDCQTDESIIEQAQLALGGSRPRGPLPQTSTNPGYRRFPVLLLDQPIDRCKKLHTQRRFEAIDTLRGQVQNFPERMRRLLLKKQVDVPTMLFVEPNRVRWSCVTEPLVAVKVGSIKSIEQVTETIREGTVLVGLELEIERIVDPERMNRPLKKPSQFLHLEIGALNSEDPIASNHLRH